MSGRTRVRLIPAVAAIAATATLFAFVVSADVPAAGSTPATPVVRSAAAIAFRNDMRKLWEEHVTWTRLFIVSFDGSLPDLNATTHRLLRNQVDIGNAVKPFYGTDAGGHLTKLLKRHIRLAAEIVAAAKSGDTQAFDRAKKAWYVNARRIARFLHSLNPSNWGLTALRSMMKAHLDLTLKEASDYLAGAYRASAHDFDRVETEILRMADTLSIGIIRQFPSKF